jgi:hypothetical protein
MPAFLAALWNVLLDNQISWDNTRRDFFGGPNNRFVTSYTVFSDISGIPPPCSFGFMLFHLKLNAAFRRRVSATKLFNKHPLAILNGTSNPIGLHSEHSLFQRISIHPHYDVKASKHLAFLPTTDWQRERQAGCIAVSLRLDYLYLISYLFVLPTSFLRIPKTYNRTSLQVWHANVLYFCFFCKPTFSGATREWDALYKEQYLIYGTGTGIWSKTNFGSTGHHHSRRSPLPRVCIAPIASAIF